MSGCEDCYRRCLSTWRSEAPGGLTLPRPDPAPPPTTGPGRAFGVARAGAHGASTFESRARITRPGLRLLRTVCQQLCQYFCVNLVEQLRAQLPRVLRFLPEFRSLTGWLRDRGCAIHGWRPSRILRCGAPFEAAATQDGHNDAFSVTHKLHAGRLRGHRGSTLVQSGRACRRHGRAACSAGSEVSVIGSGSSLLLRG